MPARFFFGMWVNNEILRRFPVRILHVYSNKMELTLPSFAKVNLHLRVLGKREDGFHEIFTVFQSVSLSDVLMFTPRVSGIRFYCDDPAVPVDGSNLMIKAADAFSERYGIKRGAEIRLKKAIPLGGGLGGGSSNAAVTLIGLSRLWGIDASVSDLGALAEMLGSDVPFFLHGGTMIGTGRGADLEPAADILAGPMLIVTPGIHVSTKDAYAALNAQNLTKSEVNRILRVCRSEAGSPDLLHSAMVNDFETVVFAAYPEIERIKQTLIGLGAERAMLSGSGASVFGIFEKEETRQTALKALDNEVNWRKFAVAAVSRNVFREALEIAS